jgi:3-(3-hydroxy-phenyl)propionate hydroxylase
MSSYTYKHYPYRRPPELDGKAEPRPVAIVGAGMAGPTLALELAARGVPSVVLDEDDTVSIGSRSICQAKHSLEVWDRFGIAQRMVDKGITWEQGEVYLGDRAIYRFNLQPEPGHKFPAFVNLQQYYVEEFLYERCLAEPAVEMRFRNRSSAWRLTPTMSRSRSRHRMAATRSRPSGWSPVTACAAPCATCSACRSRARSSTTSS